MGEDLWWHLSLLSRHEISVSFFSLSIMLLQNTPFGVRSYQFLLVRITCISKTDVALWYEWIGWMGWNSGWEEPYTAKKRWKRYLGAKLTPSVSCMEATLHRWVFIIWWNTKWKYMFSRFEENFHHLKENLFSRLTVSRKTFVCSNMHKES